MGFEPPPLFSRALQSFYCLAMKGWALKYLSKLLVERVLVSSGTQTQKTAKNDFGCRTIWDIFDGRLKNLLEILSEMSSECFIMVYGPQQKDKRGGEQKKNCSNQAWKLEALDCLTLSEPLLIDVSSLLLATFIAFDLLNIYLVL